MFPRHSRFFESMLFSACSEFLCGDVSRFAHSWHRHLCFEYLCAQSLLHFGPYESEILRSRTTSQKSQACVCGAVVPFAGGTEPTYPHSRPRCRSKWCWAPGWDDEPGPLDAFQQASEDSELRTLLCQPGAAEAQEPLSCVLGGLLLLPAARAALQTRPPVVFMISVQGLAPCHSLHCTAEPSVMSQSS